jgi:molecular chaperone HscA
LGDDEIAGMLKDSFSFASKDKFSRQLAEQQVAAQQLLDGLDVARDTDGEALLDAKERAVLDEKMAELKALLDGDDLDSLRTSAEQLGRASENFAARRMDKSIKQALSGVSLDELAQGVEE